MEKIQKETISELATLLHDNHLTEIEYESNGTYIRVACGQTAQNVVMAPAQTPLASTPAAAAEKSAPVVKKETIDSPMVGVVYLTKDPSAPAFVKVGDTVSAGQVVCLIEAMKTYNPIKSTKAGKIAAVLVESGKPVEFGQPLFEIE